MSFASVLLTVAVTAACANPTEEEVQVSEAPSTTAQELSSVASPVPSVSATTTTVPSTTTSEPAALVVAQPADLTFAFAESVPPDQIEELERAVLLAVAFYQSRGYEFGPTTVFVDTDAGRLAETIRQTEDLPPETGGFGDVISSLTRPSGVYLLISSFADQTPLRTLSLVGHEFFHILQFRLAGISDPPDERFGQVVGPVWLLEGSAEYMKFRVLDEAGSALIDDSEFFGAEIVDGEFVSRLFGAKSVSEFVESRIASAQRANFNLADLHTYEGFFETDGYAVSLAAASRLSELTGEESLFNYWAALGEGMAWPQAFEETFGISVEDFESTFRP